MNDLIKPSEPMSRIARGLWFLLLPPLTVFLVFMFVIVVGIYEGNVAPGAFPGQGPISSLPSVRFMIGAFALLGGLGMLIGFPVGIYYLATAEKHPIASYDERSGKGRWSEVPREILGWNWGAAGLTWIWGLANGVWWSFLVFVPILNYFFWIFLGVHGSEWAWRARKWESVESFQDAQRKWKPWGIFFVGLTVLSMASALIFVTLNPAGGPYWKSVDRQAPRFFTPAPSGIETLEGLRVPYRISYDLAKWELVPSDKHFNEATEYEFMHRDGDIFSMVIAERLGNIESFTAVVLENAREEDLEPELVFEDIKVIGDKEFEVFKMKVSDSHVSYFYYGYLYTGDEGTIQFVVACPQNLFDRYFEDITKLLDGISILENN